MHLCPAKCTRSFSQQQLWPGSHRSCLLLALFVPKHFGHSKTSAIPPVLSLPSGLHHRPCRGSGADLSHQLLDHGQQAAVPAEALVGHVARGALRADEDVPAGRLEADVLHVRPQPAVGLPKHGLWPQRGGHQEDVFPSQATGGKSTG